MIVVLRQDLRQKSVLRIRGPVCFTVVNLRVMLTTLLLRDRKGQSDV